MEQTTVRRGGVLLHITSLPGPECAGTLGEATYRFGDFLQSAGMRIWQVRPVGPTGYVESPYQSACALAGNPYMIDLDLLQKDGYLPDYQPAPHAETGRADFETCAPKRNPGCAAPISTAAIACSATARLRYGRSSGPGCAITRCSWQSSKSSTRYPGCSGSTRTSACAAPKP